MFNRIIGVFKLDRRLFDELEQSEDATVQAIIIVVCVTILASFGNGLAAKFSNHSFFPQFIGSILWSFVGWILWSVTTYFVGTTFFGGKGELSHILRGIGFSYAPQILGMIPCIGAIAGWLWSLAAAFIAITQGLKISGFKALLTILSGFCIYIIGYVLLGAILGGFSWFF
jgi:hypothetical protein